MENYLQSFKNEWKINGSRVLVSAQIPQFWGTDTVRSAPRCRDRTVPSGPNRDPAAFEHSRVTTVQQRADGERGIARGREGEGGRHRGGAGDRGEGIRTLGGGRQDRRRLRTRGGESEMASGGRGREETRPQSEGGREGRGGEGREDQTSSRTQKKSALNVRPAAAAGLIDPHRRRRKRVPTSVLCLLLRPDESRLQAVLAIRQPMSVLCADRWLRYIMP